MNATQLTKELAVANEWLANCRREIEDIRAAQVRLEAAASTAEEARVKAETDRAAEVAALRLENAVQKARLDDQAKRLDTWSARAWGLVTVFVGTVLSLTSALVVAVVRR